MKARMKNLDALIGGGLVFFVLSTMSGCFLKRKVKNFFSSPPSKDATILQIAQGATPDISYEYPQSAIEGYPFTIRVLNLTMISIPPGSALVGSPLNELGRRKSEKRHPVHITKSFWLGKTEVTQGQWESLMGNNPSCFKNPNLPVESVSWNDAMLFCQRLTLRERSFGHLSDGYEYTLPTEAQWEYACRSGSETPFYFGNSLGGRHANYNGNFPYFEKNKAPNLKRTSAVDLYLPNAWGLLNMHGNVYEWCLDVPRDYPDGLEINPIGKIPHVSTTGILDHATPALRGGSWLSDAWSCRSAARNWDLLGLRARDIGFRIALCQIRGDEKKEEKQNLKGALKIGFDD
jgi:formylglycine-generating enzyme required for sulfatase activity